MGDTGSLALGGFVAGCGYMLQMPLYIAIIGVIYLVEVCSVILQVGYFKLSGGKRIFRMGILAASPKPALSLSRSSRSSRHR